MYTIRKQLLDVLNDYWSLGISQQIDYDKFYLYSLITHSTAIEGSTVTEVENQLLFDEGISAKGRSIVEQLMNLDLKSAYEASRNMARAHTEFSVGMLKGLSAQVMKNTGSSYSTLQGSFDSSKGDLRLVNVTAGTGGNSYVNFMKVPSRLEEFCKQMNERRKALLTSGSIIDKYVLSFDAHYLLVTIHPWVDGNGRMSRLIMNHVQFEFGLVPSKVEKDDKADYIQSLIESREQESPEPFREFMLKEHIKNLKNEIENYKESCAFDPINSTRDLINEPIKSSADPITANLYEEIKRDGKRSYAAFASVLGVSEATVKRRLKEMKAQGTIKREGSKKTGYWVVCEGNK